MHVTNTKAANRDTEKHSCILVLIPPFVSPDTFLDSRSTRGVNWDPIATSPDNACLVDLDYCVAIQSGLGVRGSVSEHSTTNPEHGITSFAKGDQ